MVGKRNFFSFCLIDLNSIAENSRKMPQKMERRETENSVQNEQRKRYCFCDANKNENGEGFFGADENRLKL